MDKKILIVYYSLTGNTQFIAETIQDAVKADLEILKPVKELNPNSSLKYMKGGLQAIMKRKPKLYNVSKNPLEYDVIFLGTPVWSWTYSPALRTYLSMFDLTGRPVAIWICCGGNGKKALSRFKGALKVSHIIGENIFQEPLNTNPEESKKRAISWANEIIDKLF